MVSARPIPFRWADGSTAIIAISPRLRIGRFFTALESLFTLSVAAGAIAAPALIAGFGERGALLAAGLIGPTGALLAWRTLRDLDVRRETAAFRGWVGLIGALDRLLATPATDEP